MTQFKTSKVACGVAGLLLTFAATAYSWDLPTEIAILKKAATAAKAVPAKREVALAAMKLAADAATANEYASAKELSTLAVGLARPTKDTALIQRAGFQQAKHNDLAKQWKEVEQAQRELKIDANNPQSNEVVGRFLCLTRQSWEEGLPYLAKSTAEDLRTAAAVEIEAQKDATLHAKAAALWWDTATARKKERELILSRSAYWYELAIPGLSGIQRLEAEQRLQQSRDVMYGRHMSKIVSDPANGVQSLGTVDCKNEAKVTSVSPAFNIRSSWMIALQFNTTEFPGGSHVIFGWADDRNGRDPILVALSGDSLICYTEDCEQARARSGSNTPCLRIEPESGSM